MRWKKWMGWIVIAGVVILIGARVASNLGKKQGKVELPIAVRVMTPQVQEALETVALSGTITAEEEANAYSKVPGKLLRYVKAEGDRVAKDETLAWVERDEIGVTYPLSPVKAPIAGVVAERLLDIGASVSPAAGMPGTPVALVVNPKRLQVVINVIEQDLPRVAEGQPAHIAVEAYPGEAFQGAVTRISPVVDRTSRTARVLVRLEPAGGKLKPGMFADVTLVVNRKDHALLVPSDALLKENQKRFVFLVEKDRAQRRDVVPGWPQGDRIEILSGLTPQDRIVVEGQTRLTEDALVKVTE